ncbi:hypothetical protein [Neoaquamicrobium sediminum]|uniref:hypothetical protein n=1 Tax=Neoaquamicrobium sediminum TaxID=1849104 RepID=UPI0015668B3C|nr:hypothetical protein [Mesorhizobium sediminum]NRC56548.1 hypothetical protein [Mesorhizobium sediminum]
MVAQAEAHAVMQDGSDIPATSLQSSHAAMSIAIMDDVPMSTDIDAAAPGCTEAAAANATTRNRSRDLVQLRI